jgi:hypothetical protein
MAMTITEQIAEIKRNYPEAWNYIKEMLDYREQLGMEEELRAEPPKFDDNDEMIGGNDVD